MTSLLPIHTGRGKSKRIVDHALVDDDLFPILQKLSWHHVGQSYVGTTFKGRPYYLHQVVYYLRHRTFPPKPLVIDHLNRNKKDNQSTNLRAVTKSTNKSNTAKRRDNTSGFKGVCWIKSSGKWQAQMRQNGRLFYLGQHPTARLAALAVNDGYRKHRPGEPLPNPEVEG